MVVTAGVPIVLLFRPSRHGPVVSSQTITLGVVGRLRRVDRLSTWAVFENSTKKAFVPVVNQRFLTNTLLMV